MVKQSTETRKACIIGLANSGKTQIFNQLTGDYNLVANYPMTTVELATGSFDFKGVRWKLFDSPGVNALGENSAEELLVRRTLVAERPEVIIQCIDSNRIRQSLRLTSELLELEIPMVLSLNAIDETAKKGYTIDAERLSRVLGIPVVKTVAREGVGMYDLKEALFQAEVPGSRIAYSEEQEAALSAIEAHLPPTLISKRKVALQLLLGDSHVPEIELNSKVYGEAAQAADDIQEVVAETRKQVKGEIQLHINRARAKWTDELYSRIVSGGAPRKQKRDSAARLAYYSRHPLYGLVFLAALLAVTYVGVVVVAGRISGFLEDTLLIPAVAFLEGAITAPMLQDVLIGEFGLLTLGLFNAIFTVLPILSVFFLIFGVIEDIGYLPNLSVLLRRFFNKIGLSGRAIMPIILGFGCKTMATLTTRSLSSRKERLIAIYLIAFALPCSPQLALNIAILGKAGIIPLFIAGLFLILVEVAAGKVLNLVIKDDGASSFIQELPPFRRPIVREVLKKTLFRLWWFLKEAIPVFVGAAAVLYVMDLIGFLDLLKGVLRPVVVTWMGLPIEMVEALILLIAREEAAAGLILRLSDAGMLTAVQSIIAVVVTTMFVPCFANVVAMFKEAGPRAGAAMLLAINASTIFLAGILNWILLAFQGMLG
ncbi:MAG: ferrous iron transport protein B [Spirochaetota bacterium]